MEVTSLPMFKALGERADYLNRRQKVITSNIANANTPDYKAKTLEPFSFDQAVQEPTTRVAQTDNGHLSGTSPTDRQADVRPAETREMAPNGNTVVLEEQMKAAADVGTEHRLTQRVFKKHVEMFRNVVRGSS